MNKNIVYFDLETQRGAHEVGGWHNASKMGLAIGVTYSTIRQSYQIYTEPEAPSLIQELQRADLVIGFNLIGFDYKVLSPYSLFDFSQIPTLDLLLDLEKILGHRISLDSLVEASLGFNKTAIGIDALRWWKQGKIKEIAQYCCYDVKATKLLHEHGIATGSVSYINSKTKLKRNIPVDWK